MGFLALPTADLHFEVSYSHIGVQEPGCYLQSTATDITNPARPRHTETQCGICQPPPSSHSQWSAALWHCTHSTLIPLPSRKDWKYLKAFKWDQLGRKLDKIQGIVSCSQGKNPCNMDVPEVALNFQPSVTVIVQSSAAAYCKIRAVSV